MKRMFFVLGTAVVGVIALLALSNTPFAGGAEGSPTPACGSKDQLLALDTQHSSDAKGTSPEDAIDKEIAPLYPNLPSSAFHKREDSDTGKDGNVEFIHNENDHIVVVLETEKIGSGWGVDSFLACNSVLQSNWENTGGGGDQ
jgi:hypothetical protein